MFGLCVSVETAILGLAASSSSASLKALDVVAEVNAPAQIDRRQIKTQTEKLHQPASRKK